MTLPPWLDRLSVRVARWPWWIVIIIVLLVVSFYSIATSELYRRALVFVTNSPQLFTTRFAKVVYDVKDKDGKVTRISGTISDETSDSVTIITQEEERITVPREDVARLTCEGQTLDGTGDCPLNKPVAVMRQSVEGKLLLEDRGRFQIKTAFGETINVLKIAVLKDAAGNFQQVRTPEGCSANPEGICSIKLKMNTEDERSGVTGVLVDSTPDTLVVQTVPPLSETINKADIVQVIDYTPASCALNNLTACNEGIFLTIGVTLLAYLTAVILGLIFGLMRVSANPVLFNISTVYVEIVRGVPLLVILLFVNFAFAPWFRDNFPGLAPSLQRGTLVIAALVVVFYVITRWSRRQTDPLDLVQPIGLAIGFGVLLIVIIGFFAAHNNLDPVQRAILGLAFGYGAFTAELFRAGIQSIGRGQTEAARSLGMSYIQAMRYVVLPQAFRVILPPLGNDFIAMLKDTSLIAILALPELTQKARLFASNTFRPFEAYITIGVLYLCMTLFLSFMVRVVERRTSLPR
jgi:polar amino acid transport system permease protein